MLTSTRADGLSNGRVSWSATTKIGGSKGGLADQQSSRHGQLDKLAGHPGGREGKHVQMGEITVVDGADSVWGFDRGGRSEERGGQSGVGIHCL